MRFGEWEGLTIEEVTAGYPDVYRSWRETPHLASPPGAETLAEVRDRALAGLESLRAAHDGQRICLVSHGVTSRMLILEALGLGLDRIWTLQLSASGISELEFREDWGVVHRMNTLVHLEQLPAAG